jgi:hypothetical protein
MFTCSISAINKRIIVRKKKRRLAEFEDLIKINKIKIKHTKASFVQIIFSDHISSDQTLYSDTQSINNERMAPNICILDSRVNRVFSMFVRILKMRFIVYIIKNIFSQ